MIDIDLIHPCELTADDAAAWSGMQAATPDFASPLLGPDFARAVGVVRADARVAIWREDGRAVGFLAHHRRPTGFARPIGAPFSDHHALISGPQLTFDGAEALRSAGLSAMRLSGLIDPHGVFAETIETEIDSFRIVLNGSADDYLLALSAQSANRHKNYRRYRRQLEKDLGPVRLSAPDSSLEAFETLLAWKREQLMRTGVHDFLRPDWTRGLLRQLFDTRDGAFQGLAVNLYAGDTLVAGHFGVRLDSYFHPWIGASDPALRAYSPGLVHQWMAIEAMQGLTLDTYDLGPGYDHWKSMFALTHSPVGQGLAKATSLAGYVAGLGDGVWSLPGLRKAPVVGRLRNRLDQIATMELTMGGRVQGVARAIAGYERRVANRTETHKD